MKQVPENQIQFEVYSKNFFKHLKDIAGVVCTSCGHKDARFIEKEEVYRCNNCHHRISIKCGTVMQSSRLPYSVWYRAFELISAMKKSTSAIELMEHLGVKTYKTVHLLMHKIRHIMSKAEIERISNQLDEYKRIRCSISVRQKRDKKHRKNTNIQTYLIRNERGSSGFFQISWISVKDLKCWKPAKNAVNGYARSHCWTQRVVKSTMRLNKSHIKSWIRKHLDNLEKNLKGIHHGVSEKYRQLYLDEFSYRTNLSMAGVNMFNDLTMRCMSDVWYR